MRISDWSSDVCSSDLGLSIFDISGRAMSAQLVRLNTTASNLANAGSIAKSEAEVYRARKPVFETVFDETTGGANATVKVDEIVTSTATPVKRYDPRSEEHTSELQSLMRISYAVFCLKKKK